MPNVENITRPITLVGSGRSGTSLIEACLRMSPNIQPVGETGGLIFGLAAGAMDVQMPSASGPDGRMAFAATAIRNALTATEGSALPRWFQKPIGLPKFLNYRSLPGEKTMTGFPAEWFWSVLRTTFPEALFFTCLRHPRDVVVSWRRFQGWSERESWRDLLMIYEIIAHPSCPLAHALFFDEVSQGPEGVRSLFEFIGEPMPDNLESVYGKAHSMGGHEPRASYADSWEEHEPPALSEAERAVMIELWDRFGRKLDLDKLG